MEAGESCILDLRSDATAVLFIGEIESTGWYVSSIFGVAPLSKSIDGSYLLFDECLKSSCVCGRTNAAEGAAFLFSYLHLATAMIRRDNAFSISNQLRVATDLHFDDGRF